MLTDVPPETEVALPWRPALTLVLRRALPAGCGAAMIGCLVTWWLATWRASLTGDSHGLGPGSLAMLALAVAMQAVALQLALSPERHRPCSLTTCLLLAAGVPLNLAIQAEPSVLFGVMAASVALTAIIGVQRWQQRPDEPPWRLLALSTASFLTPMVTAVALHLLVTSVP